MFGLFTEGIYLDLWSASHLLFGMITFILLISKRFTFFSSFFLTFLLATFWEIFEINIRVIEFGTNRVSDIVITMVGFLILHFLNKTSHFMKSENERDTVWRYVLTFWILINTLGWMSYAFL